MCVCVYVCVVYLHVPLEHRNYSKVHVNTQVSCLIASNKTHTIILKGDRLRYELTGGIKEWKQTSAHPNECDNAT